jgi:hypothetical protein
MVVVMVVMVVHHHSWETWATSHHNTKHVLAFQATPNSVKTYPASHNQVTTTTTTTTTPTTSTMSRHRYQDWQNVQGKFQKQMQVKIQKQMQAKIEKQMQEKTQKQMQWKFQELGGGGHRATHGHPTNPKSMQSHI